MPGQAFFLSSRQTGNLLNAKCDTYESNNLHFSDSPGLFEIVRSALDTVVLAGLGRKCGGFDLRRRSAEHLGSRAGAHHSQRSGEQRPRAG
jgi:hypothetical protein